VKYKFVEERTVKEYAIFIVEADSLEQACYEFVDRRTSGEMPDDTHGDDEILDFEVVEVGNEAGEFDINEARKYIEEGYQAWEADHIAHLKDIRKARKKAEDDEGPIELDPEFLAALDAYCKKEKGEAAH
jgi:hypothetical protein